MPMRAQKTASIVELLVSVSGAVLVGGCGGGEPARAEHGAEEIPVAVRVVAVTHEPIERPIRAAGILGARHETTLSFKVAGVVKSINAAEGDRVRKGQVLAAIDTTEYQSAAMAAKQILSEAEREVTRAHALQKGNAIGVAALQSAETELEVLRARSAAMEFNMRQTRLTAPEAGVVQQRPIQIGEVVGPERVAFVVSGMSGGAVVRAGLIDRDVLETQVGAPAKVLLDARPDAPLTGRVSRVATAASPLTGTFEVEVAVEGGDVSRLPSGLTAKVEIFRTHEALRSLPLTALIDGRGRDAAVFVVRGNRARRLPVQVSFLFADRAALAAGPQPGELVVDRGATRLHDGALVRVLR